MPTSLGRVQPIFKGAYDSATTYKKLDNVFYNGDTWVCQIDNTVNVTPSAESNAWQMVASKGGTGGFGTPNGSAVMLPQGSNPTINITASGPDTAKVFNFQFGIPTGANGTQTYLSSVAPTSSGGYNYFPITALLSPSGIIGGSPRQGDLVFYHNSYYQAAGVTDPALGARCGQAYTLVISAASDQQVQDAVDNYLDDHPEATGTFTVPMKDALLQLAQKVLYVDEHGSTYYQDLYDAFNSTFYSVASSVENCMSSNSKSYAKAGSRYTTTLTATPGYTLTGATVAITMGGTNITSTAYSNGTINIANVTGNISITVVAISTVSTLTATYTPSETVYAGGVLDDLTDDLVVTADYTDGTTGTVPMTDYTISGRLAVGTSPITIEYGGKTTTFSVTVEANGIVDGSYTSASGDKTLTVNNNTITLGSSQGSYPTYTLPLLGRLRLRAGDVVTFSSKNPSEYNTATVGVGFNGSRFSVGKNYCPFQPVNKVVTLQSNIDAVSIYLGPVGATASKSFTFVLLINGEEVIG